MKEPVKQLEELFRQTRDETGQGVDKLARTTGLSEEFILKLETGDFSSLPHDMYTLGGVIKYAKALGLDSRQIRERYLEARGPLPKVKLLPRKYRYRTPIVTSSLLPRLLIVAASLAVVSYIAYQLVVATGSPRLNVLFPGENQVVYTDEVELVGTTNTGSTVTIDGREINVAEDGSFRYVLILPEGTHSLVVEARSELGRTSRVERTFIVRYSD